VRLLNLVNQSAGSSSKKGLVPTYITDFLSLTALFRRNLNVSENCRNGQEDVNEAQGQGVNHHGGSSRSKGTTTRRTIRLEISVR
jgi:hypothetical protein